MYKVYNGSTFEVKIFILGSADAFATVLPDAEIALPLDVVFRGFSTPEASYSCSPIYDPDDLTDRTLLIPEKVEGKYLLIREKETEVTMLFTKR